MYSGIYEEQVDVNKELTIISQSGNPEDTVVQSYANNNKIFNITANNVTISGFKVNARTFNAIYLDNVQYNNITGNKLDVCSIHLNYSSNNSLNDNILLHSLYTLLLVHSDNNLITNNNIGAHEYGIGLRFSNNNTITGNDISGSESCLELESSSNNTVSNNSMIAMSPISLSSSSNNNILRNNYVNIGDSAICLFSSSNNTIYNNYFNADFACDNGNNIWNITKIPGTNIVGGPFLGGNYWSDYTGNDTDGDGLGDTLLPYNCNGYIVNGGDYLPLVVCEKYNPYDTNKDCKIDLDELSVAIDDFYAGTLDIEGISEIIDYYHLGEAGYC